MTQVFLQTSPPILGFHESSQYADNLGSMDEIPQFSFPLHSETSRQTSQPFSNTTSDSSLLAPKQNHRRSRTSGHVSAIPLPSFSFGGPSPQTAASATMPLATDELSDSAFAQTPPATSRHRRAVSEFIGEKVADIQEQTRPNLSTPPILKYRPPGMAHRHRRSHASGAIDTRDLPTFAARSISVAENLAPASSSSSLPTNDCGIPISCAGASAAEAIHTSREEAVDTASRTVTFSDRVDTIPPRPLSMVSSASSSGSQSTIRGVEMSRPEDVLRASPLQHSIPSIIRPDLQEESDSSSHLEASPGTGIDIVDLDENFDCDPTAASTLTTGCDNELPVGEYDTNQHQFSSSISSKEPLHILSDTDIDLDMAAVDTSSSPTRTSSRGSGFQKARASMHSASVPGMVLPSSMVMHRRTESAPSLSPVPFLLRSHEKAADAGFEMTDVFEEDEDDYEASPPSSAHAASSGRRYSTIPSPSEQDLTPRPFNGKRETHSSPILLPPIQFDIWRPRDVSRPSSEASRQEEPDLPPARPLFITTHNEPSISNASSPRYTHSGLSSCEPSPRFQYSVEDVPSLISSGSTVGETTLPNPSLRSFQPSVTGTATSQSSLAQSSNKMHRKRLSIMSMSVSKLFNSSTTPVEETDPFETPRSYSSAGLKPPTTKTGRLGRMLKFWRKSPIPPATQ